MASKKLPPTKKKTTEKLAVNKLEIRLVAPTSEFSDRFIQYMLDQMGGRSLERYGLSGERYPAKAQALPIITERLTEYLFTRNTKFLIDAANFAMIEFMHPSLADAFFAGTDSNESPGRAFIGGDVTSERNSEQEIRAERPSGAMLALETLTPATEYSVLFIQGMINRMGVSFLKYGPLAGSSPDKVNALDSARVRLEKYRSTNNTEFLMDAANFAMIEYMRPSLTSTFYNPLADTSSLGKAALKALK